jgi:23S rRNA pseudouridine1911/1915/1917 synthase
VTLSKNAAHYKGSGSDTAPRTLPVPHHCAGLRLDQALSSLLPEYSRSRLQQWIREGLVSVDGVAAAPKTKVWGGETLVVLPQSSPEELAYQPEDIPLAIVHEDDSLLVIDKPAGLVVHPGSGNWSGTLLNALLRHAPQLAALPRAGIVHRLDKETSGLLVVAKTLVAHTDLVRQLQARTVGREYDAFVTGVIDKPGRVDAPVGRHPVERTRMAVVASGKPAVTHFEPVESGRNWTWLRCRLETGRTHQIRVHLTSIGHPLVGDPVYRGKRAPSPLPEAARAFQRQALHAARLSLRHPGDGTDLQWQSPMPADMALLLDALRTDRAG